MAAREYVKLTPPRRTAGLAIITVTRSNLWLGNDHLLCVETEGYTEKYRRFYFRDVQAITLLRTSRMLVLGLVTGSMTAIFGLIALAASPVEVRWFFGILAGVCAVPLVVNLLYGPTCKCQLRTAVQTEEVPSLGRIRRARKFLERIRPLIAQAQGEITPEEIPLRFREMLTAPGSEPPVMQAPDSTPGVQP
jgi:hypothetical protein